MSPIKQNKLFITNINTLGSLDNQNDTEYATDGITGKMEKSTT